MEKMAALCRMLPGCGIHYAIWWILVFIAVLTVVKGVQIQPLKRPVLARDTDPVVTLPCNFTTNTQESQRITWFRYRNGARIQVMRYQDNRLVSYGELLNRVARGDRGALVLIRPNVRDSGNYSCEVEVERERPSWVKTDVYLDVKSHDITIRQKSMSLIAKESDPSITLPCDYTSDGPSIPEIIWRVERNGVTSDVVKYSKGGDLSVNGQFVGRVARGDRGDLVLIAPTVDDSGTYRCEVKVNTKNWVTSGVSLSINRNRTGVFVLISVLWILPVLCGFVLEGKVYDQVKVLWRRRKSLKKLSQPGWRYIPILIALCLMFSGTVCLAKGLSSRDHTDYNQYDVAGSATGISGLILLCSVYTISVLVRRITFKRRDDRNDMELEAKSKSENTGDENKPGKSSDTDRLMQETSNTVGNPAATGNHFKIVENLTNGPINGMVSVSHKEIYLTTRSTLYRLDTSEVADERAYSKIMSSDLRLKMVSKYQHGVLLLAEQFKKKFFFSDSYKTGFVTVRSDNPKYEICLKDMNITSFFYEMHSAFIYLTLPKVEGEGEVHRARFTGNDITDNKPINTSVLRRPANVCKNSRGQIIVTDSEKSDVFVFNENTGFVTSMKISVPKSMERELLGCNRLAIGTDDRIYVTGPNTKRVLVFDADLRYERAIDTESSGLILCLTVHNNSLYVADEKCITVHSLAGGGKVT